MEPTTQPVDPGPALNTPDADLAALTSPEALMGRQEQVTASWQRHAPRPVKDALQAGDASTEEEV
jgi:hypothetical protein